ncbi:Mannosyl-3-phosphoglycerate phosphatase-related protein [Paramixta manurensis]|uniref:Mannosyl-3-phosphoglycerate phosphatase-related protein n=1 Tax=Paramixta manurensis TaxID=2740817 RepID=A0A6M8UL33_9GAMM|nr:Mannosyl-3-phosphoglycerate phosphatase-related protein [Erwiniaceae bacterium PD-1]
MPDLYDPLMIVTDLDGSLLDHHTYCWSPAQPWLTRLQQHAIPLVICSSKTAAEIIPLQQQLGLSNAPFIAENGALVQYQDAHDAPLRHYFGKRYSEICRLLHPLHHQFRFTGFADFSEQEVAEMTGLSLHDAMLSRRREASETLIWRDSEAQRIRFQQHLAQEGLTLIQGGRFWHVMSSNGGKGAALAWLLQNIQTPKAKSWLTLGLGDGPNDAPMLDSVDYAVIIKGYSKFPVELTRTDEENVYRTNAYGPEGWSEGLDYFISQT